MPKRISSLKIGNLTIPIGDVQTDDFIITQMSGLSDLVYKQTEVQYDEMFAVGDGRDITIVLTVKPGVDYRDVRRHVAQAIPLDIDIPLYIYMDDDEAPYAETICVAKNVSATFGNAVPTIGIELSSIYTCLKSSTTQTITDLLFGVNAQLDAVTHDYTPVVATIHLSKSLADWYRVYISSDWISINTLLLKTNYGITSVLEGSTIEINSDPETFSVELKMPREWRHGAGPEYFWEYSDDDITWITTDKHWQGTSVMVWRQGSAPDYQWERSDNNVFWMPTAYVWRQVTTYNIETACDVGEYCFRFAPNEPMLVKTMKIPSAISGETLTLSVNPRYSGV